MLNFFFANREVFAFCYSFHNKFPDFSGAFLIREGIIVSIAGMVGW